MIGGGDHTSARQRWEHYAEGSMVGSGIYSIVEARRGQLAHARVLSQACGKASTKAGITLVATAATVGTTVATMGVGAPVAIAVGVSAASAATVTGLGNERLLEVRRRIWERRGSTCERMQGEVGTEGKEDHWDMLADEMQEMGLDPECPMECAICLEDAFAVPGIARVHRCGTGCGHHGEGCCQHAFHRSCIEEWRQACEMQGEEFTCPECRRALQVSDVEAMPRDDLM